MTARVAQSLEVEAMVVFRGHTVCLALALTVRSNTGPPAGMLALPWPFWLKVMHLIGSSPCVHLIYPYLGYSFDCLAELFAGR